MKTPTFRITVNGEVVHEGTDQVAAMQASTDYYKAVATSARGGYVELTGDGRRLSRVDVPARPGVLPN